MFDVEIKFAHGIVETFPDITGDQLDELVMWIETKEGKIHRFEYRGRSYWLNCEFVCSMVVSHNG